VSNANPQGPLKPVANVVTVPLGVIFETEPPVKFATKRFPSLSNASPRGPLTRPSHGLAVFRFFAVQVVE